MNSSVSKPEAWKVDRDVVLPDTVFELLLQDKTTGRHIIWATEEKAQEGTDFVPAAEITVDHVRGPLGEKLIQPRVKKLASVQSGRTRDKGEVFTPCWVCNQQNNLVDYAWFGTMAAFNTARGETWDPVMGHVFFPDPKRSWKKYIDAQRLEISCGEAPYLVSPYDTVTGEAIPLERRIGLLDRKLRVVTEQTESREEWIFWSLRALESIYGYEYQGDSLFIARRNVFYTYLDYFEARFHERPELPLMKKAALIISWNLWQMDGLKCVVPLSCYKVDKGDLFKSDHDESAEKGNRYGECPGCLHHDVRAHNGMYCRIRDWRSKTTETFISMWKGGITCGNQH